MSKYPKYTKKRSDSNKYYFSLRIPNELQDSYGKKNIEYSLKTSDRNEATQKALTDAGFFKKEFERLRSGDNVKALDSKMKASVQDLTRAANYHYLREKKFLKALYRANHETGYLPDESYRKGLSESLARDDIPVTLEQNLNSLKLDLIHGDYLNVMPSVNMLIDELHFDMEKPDFKSAKKMGGLSKQYIKLCDMVLRGSIKAHEEFLNPESSANITLLEFSAMHEQSFTKDTRSALKPAVDRFVAFAGNIDVADVTPKLIFDFTRWLSKIDKPPKNARNVDWNGLYKASCEAAPDEIDTFAKSTVENGLSALRTLFYKALGKFGENGLISANPFIFSDEETKLLYEGFSESVRRPYDFDDLKKIFSSKLFTQPDYASENFWGVLLLFYTGARPSEIGSLKLSDMESVTDNDKRIIYYFNVTRSKSSAGIRPIVVHEELIELGLIDYIENLRSQNNEYLFPSWGSNEWEQISNTGVSEWLNKSFLDSVGVKFFGKVKGVKLPIRKDGYSIRHTFQDGMRDCKADESVIKLMVGHSQKMMYGEGGKRKAERIADELAKFDTTIAYDVNVIKTIKSGKLVTD